MNTIITIGRESGSAGHKIGKLLAEELGIPCYDRELLEKGIDRETVRNAKEDFLFEQKVDEFEDALEIARKEVWVQPDVYGEAPRAREVDDRLTAKIARKLEGKGFSKGDIFRVLDRVRREAKEDPGETGW